MFDKVMCVFVAHDRAGFALEVRELDVYTRHWGATFKERGLRRIELMDGAFTTVRRAGSPLAQVESVSGEEATLRVRGGVLPRRADSVTAVWPGDVFMPMLRAASRDGETVRSRAVPWTFLVVREVDRGLARCQVISGVRGALRARRRGRTQSVALGVASPGRSTELQFLTNDQTPRPLTGFEVSAYSPADPAPRLLGRTDLSGRLTVPPAEHPLRVLIVRSGREAVAQLPLVPGLATIEQVRLAGDPDRLRAEAFVSGVQEEVIDLVARMELLSTRALAHIERRQLEQARALLTQMRRLPTPQNLRERLRVEQDRRRSSNPRVQQQIDRLFDDTRRLISRAVDPQIIPEVEDSLRDAREAE